MSDTDKLITIKRLEELLAAYGARPALWPPEERAAAQVLIDSSDHARALFEEEQSLDSLLGDVAEPEVSAALHSRVRSIAMPVAPAPSGTVLARLLGWLRPQSQMAWQGAVAAAGILGVVTGVGLSATLFNAEAPAAGGPVLVQLAPGENTGASPNSTDQISRSFSLTGEIVVDPESRSVETDNDDGSFTVAGIPLY